MAAMQRTSKVASASRSQDRGMGWILHQSLQKELTLHIYSSSHLTSRNGWNGNHHLFLIWCGRDYQLQITV
jgi:hypothetical protein